MTPKPKNETFFNIFTLVKIHCMLRYVLYDINYFK
jgi:hypothetical protein